MKKLAVVGTFVAGTAVGLVCGGALAVRTAIKSESIRKAIADRVVEYLLPEPRNRYSYYSPRNNSRVSYRTYYTKREDRCLYETPEAAESALESMRRVIEEYGQLSLQDFYDVCGMDIKSPSFETIGWKNIDDAKVMFTGRWYEILLPETVVLDA